MSGADDNVVSFERGRRRPDPARLREFADVAKRLESEKRDAGEAVERLLRETPREQWPSLATAAELRSAAGLEALTRTIRAVLEKTPQDALALSNIATAIAETLSKDAYPPVMLAQMRATAWKDRANVLTYLSRYDEALDAVGRAEDRLDGHAGVALDRAIVRLTRAITLQSVDRFDESFALMREAGEVFRELGDTKRLLQCGIAHGAGLYRCARYREAREVFMPLLVQARAAGDADAEARLYNNLGYCATQLGDFDVANEHFSMAVMQFQALGRPLEALRIERGAGVMLVQKGNVDDGVLRLTEARRRFLMHGLVDDAGICGLEIVEVLLARGSAHEASALARAIVDEYTTARLNNRAITALAYLREAIDQSSATPGTVRYIHRYLEALRVDPAREFIAMHA